MTNQNINVALIGNPNTGKTSVFNQLTGVRADYGIACKTLTGGDKFISQQWIRILAVQHVVFDVKGEDARCGVQSSEVAADQ